MIKKKKYKYIYPSILLSSNTNTYNVNTNSWFNIIRHSNTSYSFDKLTFSSSFNSYKTFMLKFTPSDDMKQLFQLQFNSFIDIYNKTNSTIKSIIKNHNISKKSEFNKNINFIKLRNTLTEYIDKKCKSANMYRHTGDYAVKHCVEMYKSAVSNHKFTDKFDIKDWSYEKSRKMLVFEPCNITLSYDNGSVESIKIKKHKIDLMCNNEIKEKDLPKIEHNIILQYDFLKNEYYFIIPIEVKENVEGERYKKCGIDIGCRTFMTVYSPEKTYEIGTKDYTYDKIDTYLKKKDSINKNKDEIKSDYRRTIEKYSRKLKNIIKDMHNKTINFLVNRYDTINIGNVSTKSMVSKLGNLPKIVKRRIYSLEHYKFRMKLIEKGEKYGCNINLVDEYMTTQNCSNCGNRKKDIGIKKEYECMKCGMETDRDINSAINIYKM